MSEYMTCDNKDLTWEDLVRMLLALVGENPNLRIVIKDEA